MTNENQVYIRQTSSLMRRRHTLFTRCSRAHTLTTPLVQKTESLRKVLCARASHQLPNHWRSEPELEGLAVLEPLLPAAPSGRLVALVAASSTCPPPPSLD